MKQSSRQRLALLLVAWYLPFVLTLDLHHNHSSIIPAPQNIEFTSIQPGDFYAADHETKAPCPVLLVLLGHGPLPTLAIDLVGACCETIVIEPVHLLSEIPSRPSARSPPAA